MALAVSAPALAQNRIGGVVRDETGVDDSRRHSAGGNRRHRDQRCAGHADDRDRRSRPVRLRRHPLRRMASDDRSAGIRGRRRIPLSVRLGGPAPNLDVKLDRRESPEAFGALAGVDSKSLSAQLAAAAALYDEGRYDQAIAAYREIKARAPALSLVNMQIGNSYLAKKSYAEAEAAYQEVLKNDAADSNGSVRDGSIAGSTGQCSGSAELVREGGGRGRRPGPGR